MTNTNQKKINKNNRKRGSHFEKIGADFLDMDVVPYSGSNARFGYGDVRDSKWLGEFKNITPQDGRVRIKQEWIKDNTEKANMYGLMPFLAWMPAGKSDKYVILDQCIFDKLDIKCNTFIEIPKKSINAVNMFIDLNDSAIKSTRANGTTIMLIFGDLRYYMMSMETFKSFINAKGLKGDRQNYGTSECNVQTNSGMEWHRL